MKSHEEAIASGRDFYVEKYETDLDGEAKWLEYGAREKADSIDLLIKRGGIKLVSLLELGCGTGAVIKECARRKMASRFLAIDYSPKAVERLRHEAPEIECVAADITDSAFCLQESFDVVVLSHVLEHLENPVAFLRTIKDHLRFRHLIIEVPLENLLLLRVKARIVDRATNPAGHVQFFTSKSFKRLLTDAGLTVNDERWFVPKSSAESVRFMCKKDRFGKIRTAYKLCTMCYLPRIFQPLWQRFWYSHLAVRCSIGSW